MAKKNPKKSTNKKSSGGLKKAPPKKATNNKNTTALNYKKTTKSVNKKNKPKVSKTQKKELEYVRISQNAKLSTFHEMGKKVQEGLFRWAFYGVDGNVGYHYYVKLK